MKRFTVALIGLLACTQLSLAQPAPAKKDDKPVYARGRVQTKNLPAIRRAAFARNGYLQFPRISAPTWDCRQLGIVPPVVDQGQCGSCWDFSGTGVVTSAFMKAMGTAYPGPLSEQYTLDCGQNGGCNGDDNVTVLQWAKSTGLPTTAEYGAYQARSGKCKSGVKLYKINDFGFCDGGGGGGGVASVQQIKDALAQYGPIGCGIDAGGLGDGTGIISGTGHSIDHDVIIVGWDDTKGKSGCWIMRNSWGTGWGQKCGGTESGYCYIEYGAWDIGTEACWATVAAIPPPPPTPVPPGPTPPVPPGPVPPTPTTPSTITLSADMPAGSYLVVPGGSVIIHGGMTLREALDALERCKQEAEEKKAKCCEPISAPTRKDDDPLSPANVNKRLERLEKDGAEQKEATNRILAVVEKLLSKSESPAKEPAKK